MPSAEIITIGTEILLGEIQDTNTVFPCAPTHELAGSIFFVHILSGTTRNVSLKRSGIH